LRPSNEYELSCHPNFEGHQAEGEREVVTCDEAREVWDLGVDSRRNTAGRTAEWLITGRTVTGRAVTVAVMWREEYLDWQAYNAWDV
jgi:hypothetical protein